MIVTRRPGANVGVMNALAGRYHRSRLQVRRVLAPPCLLSTFSKCNAEEAAQITKSPQLLFPQALAVHEKTQMVTTRTKFYGRSPHVQDLDVPAETLAGRRQRWSTLLRQSHYMPVILEVLDAELLKYANSTIIDPSDRIAHDRECALILASAPSVFAAAVDGSLTTQLLTDANLQKEYAIIDEQAQAQPSIYVQFLADKNGIAPTPSQYLLIRDMVQDYLAEGQQSTHAWQLDNMTGPSVSISKSAQGYRKYLHRSNRSSQRVETLRKFCEGIKARVFETPAAQHNIPFHFPPGECGYSGDLHRRLAQHRARQSSNYIMNLVEDICTYLHRTGQFQQQFRMHQHIIYLIFRPSQAAIAEIFCSGLLQVWTENGGGFNAYPAGRSVATSQLLSDSQWGANEAWVRENSHIEENMRVQQERAEDWRKAIEWKPKVMEDEDMLDVSVAATEESDRYDCV